MTSGQMPKEPSSASRGSCSLLRAAEAALSLMSAGKCAIRDVKFGRSSPFRARKSLAHALANVCSAVAVVGGSRPEDETLEVSGLLIVDMGIALIE